MDVIWLVHADLERACIARVFTCHSMRILKIASMLPIQVFSIGVSSFLVRNDEALSQQKSQKDSHFSVKASRSILF